MSLKKRDIDLLRYIVENETLEEILSKLKISERNIRYGVENLNFYLEKILNRRIVKRIEYKIDITEKELDFFLKEIYKNYYLYIQEERSEYLLLSFLFRNKIRLSNLEKELDITRATLKKDMEYLNKELGRYGLKIESIKNSFSIYGNEKKYRHLKTLKFLEYKKSKGVYKDLNFIFSTIDIEKVKNIKEIVDKMERDLDGRFPKEFKELMCYFIYFSKERVEKGYIIDRKSNYRFLERIEQFEVVKNNFSELIDGSMKFEIAHMTEYFLSYGLKNSLSELKFCVEQFLANLFLELNRSVSKEIDWCILKEKFLYYLISAIYRLRNNFSIGEVGKKGRFFKIVKKYVENDSFLPERLTDYEIYFLSQHIEKLYEKKEQIDIDELLNIVEKYCENLRKEELKKELLEKYSLL